MNKKNAIIIICLLVIFSSTILSSLTEGYAKPTAQSIDIISHNGFLATLHPYTWYVVVGEIKNIGTDALQNVSLTIDFYDSHGKLLDTISSGVSLSVILVGRKAPFLIMLTNETKSEYVDRYEIVETSWELSEGKEEGLLISNTIFYNWTVMGRIKNEGENNSRRTKIIATFYDQNGDALAVNSDFLLRAPDGIPPGQKETFTIPFPFDNPNLRDQADAVYVTAESMEFVSEEPDLPDNGSGGGNLFVPLAIVSIAAILVISYVLTMRKKRKKTMKTRLKKCTCTKPKF